MSTATPAPGPSPSLGSGSRPALRFRTRAAADPRPAPALARLPIWLSATTLAVILIVFAGRCLVVASTDSITSDETTYLVHALHFWTTGDDLSMWELGSPRLPHLLNALPSYLLARPGDLPGAGPEAEAVLTRLVLSGSGRVLLPARVVGVMAGLGLLVAVYWSVARRRGASLGLAAAGLVSLVPEVIAHSSLAASDVPFTAAAFVAIVMMARYAERPGRGRWLALALAVGAAWAMRHTALLLVITAGAVHLACAWRARKRDDGISGMAEALLSSILATAVLGAVAFGVLWAADGLGTVTLGGVSRRSAAVDVPRAVGPLSLSSLPIPSSALSVVKQARHQGQGHEAFFLGETSNRGWPLYFPVAFLLKTPIGLLALMALAAARFRPRDAWEWVGPGFLALLWIVLVRNRVNIGVRYALLTYPLAAPWLARLFEKGAIRDRVWGPLTALALAAFLWASFSCHPRYLSYFNEIGGGPGQGWIYLADSNVDWGQDFGALAVTIDRLGIKEVTTDVTSERRLNEPGLVAVANPTREFQAPAVTPENRRLYDPDGGYLPVYTRYFAASVSRLHGLYSQNDLSWLRTRKVVARVGDSVFLFDMDRPADRPLAP